LRRYVRACGLPPDAAEDVVQEAFLALFHHRLRGGGAQNLKGWLVLVCYRLASSSGPGSPGSTRGNGTWIRRCATWPIRPSTRSRPIVSRQRHRRVRAVLRALPERDRQCLSMRAEGVTYRGIAAALGMSLGAVAKAVTRGGGARDQRGEGVTSC
jgi:RNA polymerase sigma-70 factor (ECF subfamily)